MTSIEQPGGFGTISEDPRYYVEFLDERTTIPGELLAKRTIAGLLDLRAGSPTFGHNGSNCCVGWADPEHDLVVAYLTDRLVPTPDHLRAVSEAVRAACS